MLNKISIENYKSIEKVEIDIKDINILIGSNGAGKSNFISFFKLLNSIVKQKLQSFVGLISVKEIYSTDIELYNIKLAS